MKIKKQLKREKARRKNVIILSIIIMVVMPYLVLVLNDQGVFRGWEVYFAFSYAGFVDLLLLFNIFRLFTDGVFDFHISNEKVKIKDSLFKAPFTIQLDRILYVDVLPRHKDDFEILIIIEKGKRNKKFNVFSKEYVKLNLQYKEIYNHITNAFPNTELCSYSMRKAGSKKYYYLYLLYKSAYNSEFTQNAVDYIKRFMEEYDLS